MIALAEPSRAPLRIVGARIVGIRGPPKPTTSAAIAASRQWATCRPAAAAARPSAMSGGELEQPRRVGGRRGRVLVAEVAVHGDAVVEQRAQARRPVAQRP